MSSSTSCLVPVVVVEVLIFGLCTNVDVCVLCTDVDVCVVVPVVVVNVSIFVIWLGSSRCMIVDGWVVELVPVVKYQ
jgi:hypothetical protein